MTWMSLHIRHAVKLPGYFAGLRHLQAYQMTYKVHAMARPMNMTV
jgi:hypothetical protein